MRGKLTTILNKYKNDQVSIARISCAQLSYLVLNDTPVLSGSLSASWTVNNGPPKANNVTIDNEADNNVRNAIASVVNSLQVGDTYSFANGKPYVRRIEYEGWSAKARGGMLRVNVARWQYIVGVASI